MITWKKLDLASLSADRGRLATRDLPTSKNREVQAMDSLAGGSRPLLVYRAAGLDVG